MLGNAFDKLDQDRSGGLDRSEFKAMYEVLKPGLAEDEDGKKTVSQSEEFSKMDHNSDGQVSKDEMQTTGVLMPADLTDDSLTSMIKYLNLLNTVTSKDRFVERRRQTFIYLGRAVIPLPGCCGAGLPSLPRSPPSRSARAVR